MSETAEKMNLIPRIPSSIAWRAYDGEVLVVSSDDAQVRTLSDVGSFAFERFDGASDLDGVAKAIVSEFDVTEETARDDLLAFAEELQSSGLIVWVE